MLINVYEIGIKNTIREAMDMKMTKSSTAIGAFFIGMTLLITSAIADVVIESGYYGLKNSAKTTMEKLTNEVDSFTVNVSATLKIDEETYVETENVIKYDMANQAKEDTGIQMEKGEEFRESYSYEDTKQHISKDYNTGKYYVWKKVKGVHNNEDKILENPFEEEQAEDVEKIVDAFVGSLQDVIQVEEIDNKKIYIGNLSDTQVPSLINALFSFAFKYSIFNEHNIKKWNAPYPNSNIYITNISGKAVENEDRILENIIGRASVSAEDGNGIPHTYTVEFSIEIKDINNTTVTPPDLEGQEVEYSRGPGFYFDEKYLGIYKNDIVKQEGNSFVKQGERILEITAVQADKLTGRYYEVYKDEYAPEKPAKNFEFTAERIHPGDYYLVFKYNDSNGEQKTGMIHQSGGIQNLDVKFDVEIQENGYFYYDYDEDYNSEFIRVFE